MQCKARGCTHAAASVGSLCGAHRNRQRRQGHAEQTTIGVQHIRRYLPIIRKRINANASSPLWPFMESDWRALIARAEEEVADKGPYERHKRLAAEELIKVAKDVPFARVLETVTAMVFLWDEEPRLFPSDDSFRVQVARRVRALTNLNCGTIYDHKERRVRRFYRDIPFKAARFLGQQVVELLAPGCLGIVRVEQRERAQAEANEAAKKAAMQELK